MRSVDKRELLQRNIESCESVYFLNTPFAEWEQDRLERLTDLKRRLHELGESESQEGSE